MAFIKGLNQFLNICWGRKKDIKIQLLFYPYHLEYELNYGKVKRSISTKGREEKRIP